MREISVDLPAFGKPDEPDVGEQFQMQLKLLGFAGHPFFEAPRRAIGGADEARVAASADAALREQHALARLDEIADERPDRLQGLPASGR